MSLLVLNKKDVEKLLSMPKCIELMRDALAARLKARGNVAATRNLDGEDPKLLDAKRPRMRLSGPRPLCAEKAPK